MNAGSSGEINAAASGGAINVGLPSETDGKCANGQRKRLRQKVDGELSESKSYLVVADERHLLKSQATSSGLSRADTSLIFGPVARFQFQAVVESRRKTACALIWPWRAENRPLEVGMCSQNPEGFMCALDF
jgi:hypothetical protein